MSENTVQLRDRGILTLPVSLRRKYNLRPGDVFTLIEVGGGNFMLSRKVSRLAGLSLPWSQGQVEGQVNRLKLVKRSMYGRAGFDLLKRRVLAAVQRPAWPYHANCGRARFGLAWPPTQGSR